ncbi:hypothetical protein BUALT_Bualt01G0133900 [Buddleja alternifolia]|uniref:Retrotransposon gag domain-containing protein n=1 Tax=Buddleja alternifolia TaxID=168488 RepID=A0AAV6Y6U4_9LAMI|nr:hypothetical protein BUALT_Bualt01G0133900 [Buddleja alternifolia]
MPMGYQPPKLQQFDGKGNPKQHVAHFMETCNNAGTDGDLLVKQFVRSLKGNAFDWYVNLEPESIDSWDQMEREFLNHFYSTHRTVSMIEFTNAKQWKDEPVVDYINRWRALSLNCKDKLSEISSVEMCIQGMHWGLLYILQGIKPRNFKELATCAHDMELSIANHGANFPLEDQRKKKKDFKKVEKYVKSSTKEPMVVKATPIKISTNDKKHNEKVENQCVTYAWVSLKEMQKKEYPFPDSDVSHIFQSRSTQRKLERQNYALARDGKIILDNEDVANANHASIDVVTSDSQHKVPSLSSSAKAPLALQFGSLEPAMVKILLADEGTMNEDNYVDKFEEDSEWILVTRRRRQRRCIDELHPLFLKKSYSPTARKPNPMKVLKTPHVNFKKPSKSNHRTPVTLDDFFPKKFF